MPISRTCSPRPIDTVLAHSRVQLAAITAIDREAIEVVSHDPAAARRLALLASELRRAMTAEVELW
jgi:hypothetical protein